MYEELKNVGLFGQLTAQVQNCVTGVVKRSVSQSQILKGIQDKTPVAPKDFLMAFRDEMMDYEGKLKLVL